ncbi:cilia- and flagella-associated protein 157-like [Acanthopagrus latus]|uniref:cilia- and flagella-associated protein 157-like n=1 Tax=Acanthopagrus latus TaxID=8177 RepID=UPI00187C093B|nr:cilia- and flagella-associated protein 157-like [Acanthopagrus latus]
MPKMKDKKSENKEDEDKKTSQKDSSVTDADSEKAFYLTQIRYLDEQLERYQLKCDQLERQKNDLNSKYNALETQKKDIVEFLKHSLLGKEEEVDELTERLESQQQAASNEREALQLQHSQLKEELLNRIEELTTENEALVARLAVLEEHQKSSEQLTANIESLEKELACQKEEHKAEIHNQEMRVLQEKWRLEKDLAAEVQQQVEQKIPEMTRLTLQENTEVRAQFSKLSEQALVMIKENSTLREQKNQLRLDVDSLEEMLSKTSHQSCISKKLVQQLTEKCQQLQEELKDCRQELKQFQTERTAALAEMEVLRQGRASLFEQCSKTRAEESRLEAELQEERRRMSRMKSMMQDTAVTLKYVLMEAPTMQEWKQLIQKLLVENYTTENDQLNEQLSDLAAAREGTLNPASDLGVLPPPTLKQKDVLSGTGAGSNSTHVPLHRKPSSQKTSNANNPNDSALKFLTQRK